MEWFGEVSNSRSRACKFIGTDFLRSDYSPKFRSSLCIEMDYLQTRIKFREPNMIRMHPGVVDQPIFHSETANSSTLKFGRTGSGDLSSELYRRLIWAVGRVWALFNHPDGQTATPKHFGMLSKAFWTLYNPNLPPIWDFGSEDLTG